MAPGPPKAIGKGLFTNGFIAMLLVERFEAGRSANWLATGLARQGAEISPATLAGTVAQGRGGCWRRWRRRSRPGTGTRGIFTRPGRRGGCSARTAGTARRDSGSGWSTGRTRSEGCFLNCSAKNWIGIKCLEEDTGKLIPYEDGGPRLVGALSTDFYAVYESAGNKAGGRQS